MSPNFPSRDKLSSMTLDQLRSQIPYDMDDEKLLQEIVDLRVKPVVMSEKIYRNDIQQEIDDLGVNMTPEKEAELQIEIDKRAEIIKKRAFGEEDVLTDKIEKLEEEKVKIEEEMGLETKKIEEVPILDEKSDIKCTVCGSRGFRHKRGCPVDIKE